MPLLIIYISCSALILAQVALFLVQQWQPLLLSQLSHGTDDQLIVQSGGERTAELIPGSKLLLIDDMGHDLPQPLWPVLIGAILDHVGQVVA